MQSSGIIQARKMLLFAALFLAILVPTFLHPRDPLATVSRLSVRRLAPDHICS